jgi:hypothetical protein
MVAFVLITNIFLISKARIDQVTWDINSSQNINFNGIPLSLLTGEDFLSDTIQYY